MLEEIIMELPINSRISTIKEHNEVIYNIPLIDRKNSIIRYAGGAIFFCYFSAYPFS
jgi:hypothetical protein